MSRQRLSVRTHVGLICKLTEDLRARASDLPAGEQVIQVNPFGGLRKREDATYLVYDTVTQRVSVGVGVARVCSHITLIPGVSWRRFEDRCHS